MDFCPRTRGIGRSHLGLIFGLVQNSQRTMTRSIEYSLHAKDQQAANSMQTSKARVSRVSTRSRSPAVEGREELPSDRVSLRSTRQSCGA